jgi:hypothetical protein
MDRSLKVVPAPHATYRRLGGESGGVILHLETAAYHRLNSFGTMIWESLGEGTTLGSLIDELSRNFDERPATLDEDVVRFVRELVDRDLLHLQSSLVQE